MDLRVLRYFLAVVREESITAAAQALHITQPTLSRQLMELEEELGTQLLIRGGRSQHISLTEKGMLLRRRAEELVDLADRTQLEMGCGDSDIRGEVSIGGGETRAMGLLAKAARQLQMAHPGVVFRLYSGNAEDVKERLEQGLLDFGVFIEPTDLQKYERIRLPLRDSWGLLLRKDHPLASKTGILPEDLCGLPLLVSRQRLAREEFSPWLGRSADRLHVVATYNLIYNAALMVEEGVGCALTLEHLVNTTATGLRFVPLQPAFEAGVEVAWKRYHTFPKAAEAFLEQLRTVCAELQ